MNLTTPLLKGIIRGTELRGDSVTSLLQKVDRNTGLFAGDDGGLGMVMSGLAGVAAALAVAILLSVYFVAYDMRQAAFGYLGIDPARPAIELEIRLPKAVSSAISYTAPNDALAIR